VVAVLLLVVPTAIVVRLKKGDEIEQNTNDR